MFNLFPVAFLILLGTIGVLIPNEITNIIGLLVYATSIIWLFSSFIGNLYSYNALLEKFENIRAKLKIVIIYEQKQTELLSQFKLYLFEKYPEFEERINSISAGNADIILKYPEIKSSKTIIKLVDEMNNLASNIYSEKISIENECATIRYMLKNKWNLFIPNVPGDVITILK